MPPRSVRPPTSSSAVIAGILLGGILLTRSATAATYYVAPTGNNASPGTQAQPFSTIAKGLTALASGDTLYLRGGTYKESIDSNKQPIRGGTSWSNATVISSYPNETATLLIDVSVNPLVNLPNERDHYIIFNRIVFDASLAGMALSIGAAGAHHLRFSGCEMKNARGFVGGVGLAGANVYLNGSFLEFIDCKVHGSRNSYAFYIGGHDHLLDGCELYDNAGYAFQIYNGADHNDNHVVRNCRIHGNGFKNRQDAMTVGTGSNHLIYNNLIYGNYGGIDARPDGRNSRYYNNTIYNNGATGIKARGRGAIIKNNIIFQHHAAIVDTGSGTIQSNNLTEDPLFVNAAGNDFTLRAASPAIDKGVAIASVRVDFNGGARPHGAGYDIGAYEVGTVASRDGGEGAPAPADAASLADGAGASGAGTGQETLSPAEARSGGCSLAPRSLCTETCAGLRGFVLAASFIIGRWCRRRG